MSKRDRRQQKKQQKRRQERIRQERHQRQAAPIAGVHPPLEDIWDDDDGDEPGLVDNWDTERIHRLIAWKSDQLGPDGPAALTGFLRDQVGSDRWRLDHAQMVLADPREHSQDLAFMALEAEMAEDSADARRMAQQALEIDPDNLDALGLLLLHPPRPAGAGAGAPDPALDSCRQALERAIQAPSLVQALQRRAGDAWNQVRVRPFVRAASLVINRLTADQDLLGAIALAEMVHALDRARDPAHGERLVGLYLAAGRLEDARRLLDQDVDADDPFTVWARAWERFLAGDMRAARRQVERGRSVAPQVEEILNGVTGDDEPTEEEVRAAAFLHLVLQGNAALKCWCADGCCRTSPEERAAATSRYQGPVAALVTLGWVDTHIARHQERIAAFGLAPSVFPDLLRMADDQALHEHPVDDPAVWAPLHAVVALNVLGPTAGPLADLLPLVESRAHDEWLSPRLQRTVASYGGQAVMALVAWLADLGCTRDLRSFAVDVLVLLVEDGAADRDHVVALLMRELKRHEANPPAINADVAGALASFRAVAAEPLVKACYDAGTIDENHVGPFEGWQAWANESPAVAERRLLELAKLLDNPRALKGR